MTSIGRVCLLAAVVSIASGSAWAGTPPVVRQQPADIELRSGDRVLFLGGGFFEREYRYGLIETALTAAHPGKPLTFRNLGWSGDTVWGEARAYFGEPAEGYQELLKAVDLVGPTTIFVAYGANESFAGEDGLAPFLAQYGRLLDDLTARTTRIVLVTPLPTDAATSPLGRAAVDERNRVLSRYSEAVNGLARARGLASIDLFGALMASMSRSGGDATFQQGIHLTEAGYVLAAGQIAARTGPGPGTLEGFDDGWLRAHRDPGSAGVRQQQWAALRTLVVSKNDLFFHRWRPANVTYLYLFRKREQGNNAVEIPRFDPLIEQKEREIADARSVFLNTPEAEAARPGSPR